MLQGNQTINQTSAVPSKLELKTPSSKQSQHLNVNSERESEVYIKKIYSILQRHDILKEKGYLPFKDKESFNNTLTFALKDGVIFGFLVHAIDHSLIDLAKLHYNQYGSSSKYDKNKIVFNVSDNCNKVINAIKTFNAKSKSTEISLVNIGSEDLMSEQVDLVKGLLWQLLRYLSVRTISLHSHPELIRLVKEDETLMDLLTLSPEDLLSRWASYHLERDVKLNELSSLDIATLISKVVGKYCNYYTASERDDNVEDMEAIEEESELLNQLSSRFEEYNNEVDFADELLASSRRCLNGTSSVEEDDLGDELFGLTGADLIKTGRRNSKLITLFMAKIFNKFIGIYLPSDEEINGFYAEIAFLRGELKKLKQDLLRKDEDMVKAKEASVLEYDKLLQLLELARLEKEKFMDLKERDNERERLSLKDKSNRMVKDLVNTQRSIIDFYEENGGEKEFEPCTDLEAIPRAMKEMLLSVFELYYSQADDVKKWKEKYQHIKEVHEVYGKKILEFAEDHAPATQPGFAGIRRNASVFFKNFNSVKSGKRP